MAIDVTTLGAANSYTNKHSGGGGTSDYSNLTNKPAINDVTLSGNKSSEDLGLQDTLTFDDTPTEDSENPVTSDGVYKALGGKLNTLSGTSSDIGKLIIVDSDGNTIAISNILISDLVTTEDLHSAINGIFIVADELPTASEDTLGEIYLIPNGGENPNVRDEYLTTRGGTEGAYTYAWERIGTTDIDLSGYVPTSRTIADIDLEDDITASELREALNVENGAEANVQADWGQSSTAADDFIKNKPNIPSKVSDLENDSGFEANVQANWNEDNTSSDAYIQNKPTDMDVLKRIHFELDTPVAQNKCYKLFTVDGLHNSLYVHFNYSFGHAFENPVAGTAILRLEKGYPELINRETSLLELISDSNTFTNNIDICTRYVEEDYNLEVYIHGGSLNGYEDINCDIISCSDSINMLVIPDQLEAAPQDYNPHTDNYIPIYSHKGQIDNKVDKVEGKGLSTNDYTTAEKNKLSGIASGAEVNVQPDYSQTDNTADDYIKNKPTLGTAAAKDVGSANGVAELDSNGKVPSSQLPSYVDDVIEGYYDLSTDRFYEESAFTTVIPPEAGKSWVDVASNKSYRWTGSVYVRVDEGVQLGETASSAYRGDRGKTAYDHSQSAHARTDATKVEASSTNGNIKINGTDTNVYTHPGSGTNPHGTTASDVGLGNVGNFKAVSTAANQGLSDTEKANARNNIGAGTSSFSGSYVDLTDKPSINSVELSGNKTASELGLQPTLDGTKTVSGNPITVTDAEAMNAESVVVELEPKQDLHGYDAPWVGGAGKNKLPLINTTRSVSGVDYTVNSNGTITTDGTATALSYFVLTNDTNDLNTLSNIVIPKGTTIIASSGVSDDTLHARYVSATYFDLPNDTPFTLEDDVALVYIAVSSGVTLDKVVYRPMIRLSTETDPTFAPYSNICPITGYSEVNVERVGKNLLNINASGIVQNAMFNPQTLEIVGSENYDISDYIEVKEGVTYKYSRVADSLSVPCGVFYDKDKNPITLVTNIFTMTIPSGIKYVRLELLKVATNQQLEVGSSKTTYEPYQGNTYTIDLDGTKYGGTLDVTEGGYSDEWGYITFDGSNDENIQVLDDNKRASLECDDAEIITDPEMIAPLYCNEFPATSNLDTYQGIMGISQENGRFFVADGSMDMEVSTFRTWLSNNPIQIAYRKKTPSSVSTTPTDITLLENTNNISTDGTNITLKYQPNNVIGECKQYTDEKCSEVLPPLPTTDGTYHLSCEVTSGVGVLSWVSDS